VCTRTKELILYMKDSSSQSTSTLRRMVASRSHHSWLSRAKANSQLFAVYFQLPPPTCRLLQGLLQIQHSELDSSTPNRIVWINRMKFHSRPRARLPKSRTTPWIQGSKYHSKNRSCVSLHPVLTYILAPQTCVLPAPIYL
jgi:hypothetical protein